MSHPPPAATPVPLSDFWQMLRRHDWTYPYSDDHSVWERGKAEHDRLRELAKVSPEHDELFHAMSDWGWGGGDCELPAQPVEVAA